MNPAIYFKRGRINPLSIIVRDYCVYIFSICADCCTDPVFLSMRHSANVTFEGFIP